METDSMKGFISVLATKRTWPESGCAHNVATYFNKLRVDKENDVYVEAYKGAVVGNVDVPVKTIDELEKYKDRKTGKNPYQQYLDMRDQGYELVVGQPFPHQHGGAGRHERGIYCKNYLQIAKKQKAEKLEREKKLHDRVYGL